MPKDVKVPTVPLITIPTSLSGGEYFSLAGGTDDATHHKQGFLFSGMGSKLIILDPELCILTPEYHWLSTGVRSIDHCVEALCCLTATPASDDRAEKGLRLLVPSLLKCKVDADDIMARHDCQMAVNLAMWNVRAGIPMGGSHAIGHQLGMSESYRMLYVFKGASLTSKRPAWCSTWSNQLYHVSCCHEVQHPIRVWQP